MTARQHPDLQSLPGEGRRRVVIARVGPQLDGGRFAIKRTPGEAVRVDADLFTDGHDLVAAVVRYREVTAAPEAAGEAGPGVSGNTTRRGTKCR